MPNYTVFRKSEQDKVIVAAGGDSYGKSNSRKSILLVLDKTSKISWGVARGKRPPGAEITVIIRIKDSHCSSMQVFFANSVIKIAITLVLTGVSVYIFCKS